MLHDIEETASMYEQGLKKKDEVTIEDLVLINTIHINAMYKLLLKKGYFTEAEFIESMNKAHLEFQKNTTIH
jgi:hypothetical protein